MHNRIEVDPSHGMRIRSLVLDEVGVLGEFTRCDGSIGSSHWCSPQFNKDTLDYDLPSHGPVRNLPWNPITTSENFGKYSCDVQPEKFPRYKAEMSYLINEKNISLELTHTTSEEKAPFNACFHAYFHTGGSWEAVTVNGHTVKMLLHDRDTAFIELKKSNEIVIPELQKTVLLENEGFSYAAIWSNYPSRNNQPQFDERDDHYMCIEPVEFLPGEWGQKYTIIPAHSSRTVRLQFALK